MIVDGVVGVPRWLREVFLEEALGREKRALEQ